MLFGNPVRGTIHVAAVNYPAHPDAWLRPAGNHEPALSHDFGPSSVALEPTVTWPGGEGIAAGTYANFHEGIDIGNAGCGYDVLAAGPGKVTTSGANATGAQVIVIDHGQGFASRYAHLSVRLVALGALVVKGQLIGKTGDTGISTGCHLHFAVTSAGRPVDPWRRLEQNTTTDPDAEDDMPTPSSYIPGFTADVGNPAGRVNVRAAASTSARIIRTIPAGAVETWTVTCWEKGGSVSGSDQWLVRWNGAWEYVHVINVLAGPAAPVTVIPVQLAPGIYQV